MLLGHRSKGNVQQADFVRKSKIRKTWKGYVFQIMTIAKRSDSEDFTTQRDSHFSVKPKLITFQNACQGQDEWQFCFFINRIATLDTHFETCFWRLIGKNGWI